MKNNKTKKKHSIAREILQGLGAGIGITIALSSPYGSRKIIKSIKSEIFRNKKINEDYLKNQLYYLRKRKLISFVKNKDKTKIELTENGKKYILKYKYDEIKIKRPVFWDNKWRIVIFDIPEKKRRARDAMRIKLKELGLVKFNDSVWVYPYECQREVYFVVEYWGIGQYVHYIKATSITNEKQLRRIFNIPLSS